LAGDGFDGGSSGGSSQVTALQDFNAQLVSTFGWSGAQAYAHEGFSGMNGRSDTAEYFCQNDFQTVLNFAESSRDEQVHVLVGEPGP
jgi:chitinase